MTLHPSPPVAGARDFAAPASSARLERTRAALAAAGFTVELLDGAAAARARVSELLSPGITVFTAASETLRLSGIEQDLETSGRYHAIKPQVYALNRATEADTIRRLIAIPDAVVGSVSAVTEAGALVTVSASASQTPAYAGGAGRLILIVGAQKVVADLDEALLRIESHALPLEDVRALAAYGQRSAIRQLLVLNGETRPGRTTVLLLREAIGY